MKIIIWLFGSLYLIGFVLALAVNLATGPVTPALSLFRALLWPVWVTTGRPEGQRERMD